MRNEAVSHESAEGIETGLDDQIIFPPNRPMIIEAGKLARAEQDRLERQYELQNGQTPRGRAKTATRGVFLPDKRGGRASGAIPMNKHPDLFDFPDFFYFIGAGADQI